MVPKVLRANLEPEVLLVVPVRRVHEVSPVPLVPVERLDLRVLLVSPVLLATLAPLAPKVRPDLLAIGVLPVRLLGKSTL